MVHVPVPQLIHEIVFRQGTKSLVLRLTDRSTFWERGDQAGTWRQGASDPDGIRLYDSRSAEEKSNLVWKYSANPRLKDDEEKASEAHLGAIDIGINEVNATTQGRPSEGAFTFRLWLRLEGARKFADRKFYVVGKGRALFNLPGSNKTFKNGAGEWWVSQVHVGARSFTEGKE